jgi:hypothetical protein
LRSEKSLFAGVFPRLSASWARPVHQYNRTARQMRAPACLSRFTYQRFPRLRKFVHFWKNLAKSAPLLARGRCAREEEDANAATPGAKGFSAATIRVTSFHHHAQLCSFPVNIVAMRICEPSKTYFQEKHALLMQ